MDGESADLLTEAHDGWLWEGSERCCIALYQLVNLLSSFLLLVNLLLPTNDDESSRSVRFAMSA